MQTHKTFFALLTLALLMRGVPAAHAANKIWDGGGANNFWLTGANWDANTAPVAGDRLIFKDTTRLLNTNNFAPGTGFSGISFLTPAGAYTLWGSQVSLDGNITNTQTLLTETVNLPLSLSGNRVVDVSSGAALTLGGNISGGFGLTKAGGGLLTLGTSNSFSGSISANAGIVSISSDSNLGAVPGGATPGNVMLNGGGLRSTATLTLSANRGIALGPTSGSGVGRIEVNTGTLTYQGIMANNGGTGGLVKGGLGTLTLSSANTYTGPTSNRVGNLTLDFTQVNSPANNVISSSSALSLGGETTGNGIVNNIQLTMNGKASVVNTQAFSSTSFDVGHSTIRANSGAGGSAYMNLGALGHLPGGVITFTPPQINAGAGEINTSSTNVNGILGGWATISSGAQVVNGIPVATNWATVDASGNIVPYTSHTVYPGSGTIAAIAGPDKNIILNTSGGPGSSVRVDVDHAPGAGTTTDINTLTINAQPRFGINIGSNNVLRLGKFGGIFLATVPSTADTSYELGNGTDPGNNPGANAGQNVGTLTAGGAPNTDGEIVFTVDSTSQTANGSIYCEVGITDNGSGKVSVVKTGPGPMKFRGHNSFSGNMYILQGRIQMAGSELSGLDSVEANPDAFGRGDIYVLPGGQAFPSGAGGNALQPAITNNWFLAGNGVSDNVGAIRFPNSGIFSNAVMTLIGDTRLGGGGFATGLGGQVYNKITGAFNLDFGATGNSGGGANGCILYNQQNDWTGDTSIVGRTGSGGNTRLILGNNEVIPDGFGKGNLILGNTGNNNNSECRLDLNGFTETVNGLVSFVGNEAIQFVENRNSASPATLIVGNNDASATFGGVIMDNGGTVALTKIGGGIETLTGANTYSGNTVVQGGTLALSGAGSIASSSEILINSNCTLNVSGVTTPFAAAGSVRMNGATLVGRGVYALAIPTLAMTNSELTVVVDPSQQNIVSTSLVTGGTTNRVNIATVVGISGYPAQFTLIDYTGSVGGAGNNFGLGQVPNLETVGYITNDTANSRIVLVLLSGPKVLTWTGTHATSPTFWDLNTTTNWLAFKGTVNEAPSDFNTADSTLFDDTSATGNIDLIGGLEPGGVTVNNSSLNYSFNGTGALGGLGRLTKQGSGSLFLNNSGISAFSGGVNIEGGSVTFGRDNAISGGVNIASGVTVQVGTNGNSGNLPAGVVDTEGSLVFSRGSTAYTVANKIAGAGSITKNDTAILTLSGVNNTLTGPVTVGAGTLKAGSANALGTVDGSTTVSSGASLDVNDFQLNTEPVIVGGTGVSSAGAIINSGAGGQINAMGNVTLTGDTTFGGTGRWDIRGGAATLSTGGNAYNLTKVGNNQVSLVAVTVDSALANINVNAGTFAAETSTSGLGNPASTLTVASGATFQLFNNSVVLDKIFVLNGNGLTNTVNNGSGSPTVQGATTISGNTVWNVGGTLLTWNGAIGGSGTLRKTGTAILTLGGNNTYSGGTTNTAGTLVLAGSNTGGGPMTNFPGSTLSARGSHTGPIRFGTNATLLAGGTAAAGTLSCGPLWLNNSRLGTDLGFNDESFVVTNDVVLVTGDLTLTGLTTNTVLAGFVGAATNGQIFDVIRYTGTRTGGTNNLLLVAPPGYTMTYLDPATTPGVIQLKVISAPAVLTWRGQDSLNPTFWNITTSTNWLKSGANSTFTNYDAAVFNDTALGGTVNLTTTLIPSFVTANNNSLAYTLTGSGKLTGPMGLDVTGGGKLTIANSGSNDFIGPITISAGILQVGAGGTAGNLGSGNITNDGGLAFSRSDALAVNNAIAGTGSLTNLGTGVTTLGANSFDGEVFVAQGTIRANAGSSLGSVVGATTIASGASLDVNAQTLNLETVYVSGGGVGGAGAIINSGAQSQNAMGSVTLLDHTAFGGTGRWDIRGAAASLSTGGNAYNLTKVGTNQVSLVGVLSVDAALADINVQSGTFSIETTTVSLGNPANNLTVAAGATLQMFQTTTAWDKNFLLNGNGAANTINVADGALNTIIGPMTLSGACIFSVNGGDALAVASNIGGPGSLAKNGGGTLTLSGTLSYAGNFSVNAGSVFATTAALLTNSPVINLAGGTLLDVTGLPGATLVLNSGQTIMGNGVINGGLTVSAGAAVAAGASPGVLTVTNNILLAGTANLEINRLAGTNDLLRSITGSITYGGNLVVTNIAGTIRGGDVFKLFDSGINSYLGSFSSVQLPGLGVGLSWNTSQLTVNGTVSVTGTLIPPGIDNFGQSGSNLAISGDGGVTNGTYWLVTSTDVGAPIATWVPVSTNNFDGNGNFSLTIPIQAGTPARFFRVRLP